MRIHFSILAALLLTATSSGARAQLVINELEYDQSGGDNAEYIELQNTSDAPVDLAGFSLLFVNGGPVPPAVYRTLALGPGTLAPGGYYVVCADASTVAVCDLDALPNSDAIQNGPDAVVLRNGTADIDSVSYEGAVDGFGEGAPAGADPVGSEGLSRCPDGADSSDNALDFSARTNTPGSANACGGGGGGPIGACGDAATLISAVQGTGATSPLAGTAVQVEGVVTADFSGTGALGGFYVQEEDAQQDGDPASSEGVFVYTGDQPVAVTIGSIVRVAGSVVEFDAITELNALSGVVACGSSGIASAVALTLPVADPAELERSEGMLVNIAQTLTVTGNFQLGRYGALDLSVGGRLRTPTHLATKGAPALAIQADNERRKIVLDDGRSTQNPNPIPYKDGDDTRRVGDSLAALSGILDQRFGSYRIQPNVPPVFSASNPRVGPPSVPGRLHVASANVLNYFTTIDDGQPHCGPGGTLDCRGANNPNELTRQRTKILNALSALNADILGLLEVENNESAAVQDLVDGLNARLGAGSYAYIDTGTIGTDAIKVALLYKPASVAPQGGHVLLTSATDPRFIDTLNRPVLAQTFLENASGASLTIAVNHWKSKGSSCSAVGDPDLNDGQGNCNLTRTAAAQAVAAWLTGPNILLIGDFNAYAKEDPILTLESAGYESLAASFAGPEAYSFQFDAMSGYLDHALASPGLSAHVRGFAEWHNNADEPTALDYNTEFKTDDPFDPSDPYRASDHDPLVVGIDLDSQPAGDADLECGRRAAVDHGSDVAFAVEDRGAGVASCDRAVGEPAYAGCL